LIVDSVQANNSLSNLGFPDTIPANQGIERASKINGEQIIPDTLQLDFGDVENLGNELEPITGDETQRIVGVSPLLEANVVYSARDSIFFDPQAQKVFLYGHAEIKYQELHLQAGFIEIDFRSSILFATGVVDKNGVERQRPVFSDGRETFQSRKMWYNFETKRGRTLNMVIAEGDGFLHGDIVKIDSDECIFVQGGKFTTCDCPDPHFHIAFSRAKVIPDDKVITSMANLVIMGVPTPLFLPFGFFPKTQKQSRGLLFPSFGEDANRGFYLQGLGFYTPINEFFDLSIRTDLFSRGSWAATLGSNYRRRYRHSGSLNLSYGINVSGGRGLPGYTKNRDFRISWTHNQDPKARPNSTFSASVNLGSTRVTRFNPISDEDYLNNNRSSSISYQRRMAGGRVNLSANFRANQNTRLATTNLTLPDISLSVARFNPFRRKARIGTERWYESITVNYSMSARNEIQAPDSTLFTSQTLSNMRSGVTHHIPINHSTRVFGHINLTNSIDYRMNWYFSRIERRWDPDAPIIIGGQPMVGAVVTDTIRGFATSHDISYSASMNTRFFGLVQFARGPISAIRHVVSPSISFNYRPDYSSPFWGYNRSVFNERTQRFEEYSTFAGQIFQAPAIGHSGALNFTIGNNLELKLRGRQDTIPVPDRKITIIDNLTISGGYDFIRDSLNWSDIRVSGRTRLFNQFDIVFSGSWSLYDIDETGRTINRFVWDSKKKPFLLRNSSWSTGFNYTFRSRPRPGQGGPGFQQMPGAPGMGAAGQGGFTDMNSFGDNGEGIGGESAIPVSHRVDFSVPWSFTLNYTLRYDTRYVPQTGKFERKIIQTLGVNGEINLTRNWRLGFRSGWDFEAMRLTYTSIDVYRDLHCWEMSFNWIPFGFRKSYNFSIRVKNPLLKDLRYEKRTHHLDRAFPSF